MQSLQNEQRLTLKRHISEHFCVDEIPCVHALKAQLNYSVQDLNAISQRAMSVCQQAYQSATQENSLQSLLQEFKLSSSEGLALMTLSEALLRIPDQEVAAQLIADRIAPGQWESHLSPKKPFLLNASTLMLMFSGSLLKPTRLNDREGYAHKLVRRLSQPIIHQSVKQVVARIAGQFVFAETIEAALQQVERNDYVNQMYSLDMLGEAAVTRKQADIFLDSYHECVKAIVGANLQGRAEVSVKLSALHPRYEYRHAPRSLDEIVRRFGPLRSFAREQGVSLTIDAEEMDRLELGLEVFARLFEGQGTEGSGSLGIAVQAYSPRALPMLKYLKHLAEGSPHKIHLRLVKGAYWDAEIKQAQSKGLDFYPVFTEKRHSDISYLACAEFLLANRHCFYPQFATHNAVSICHILSRAEPDGSYEFQRLHGMGDGIYESLEQQYPELKVRTYGPVGQHEVLLPYLVRRILENGANSAFLRQTLDQIEDLGNVCEHPLMKDINYHPVLPLPSDIYLPERANSRGENLADELERTQLLAELNALSAKQWQGDQLIETGAESLGSMEIHSPYDGHYVGSCLRLSQASALDALSQADADAAGWRQRSAKSRAEALRRFADLLEESKAECLSLLIREAGKTLVDALNEVREAIDFARYYASSIGALAQQSIPLDHVAGEHNEMTLEGRGVFLCISPWNFPLAIFCGQVCAALAAGNTVLAKPAESTPLIAMLAVSLLHKAGVPKAALQLLTGKGGELCEPLLLDQRLSGVAFTGSTETAKNINRTLAQREAAIIPLIAETGGQNAMIVDSSALPEQVVRDVISSAFYAAGQRCSALRVLYLQDTIADQILSLLEGAIETLVLGDPAQLVTDIGPVISVSAKQTLERHCHCLEVQGRLLFKGVCDGGKDQRGLMPPHVFEIESIHDLSAEHFGPVLHVIRYRYAEIASVVKEINDYGFGLTCGIHSRNEVWARQLATQLKVGNVYINRDTVGAIVGAQPFGGQGLSGTGFKAGGPHYLLRFMNEKTVTTNVSAIGGDVHLVAPPK